MKKLYLSFIAILIFAIANAQNSEDSKVKEIGDFISIKQECRTAAGNELDDLSTVDKVILKKSLITSIVVQLNPPKGRIEDGFHRKVIVTTSEKISRFENGVDAKAMDNVYKIYEFLFDDSSSAESFADELLEKCSVI